MTAQTQDLTPNLGGSALLVARFTIVGVGALGHLIALDLARAGARQLHLVDPDIVTPDTASRQLPITSTGRHKVHAVKALIHQYSPWTSVVAVPTALGSARPTAHILDEQVTHLIDATAEPAVTRFLAHWTTTRSAGFYAVTATSGGCGGTLLALDAGQRAACFQCFEQHRHDRALPTPPEQRGGWITPPRCSQATYLGYGHDLALIAHQASRRVLAGILIPETCGAQYAVATLDRAGAPPTWQTVDLQPHPACTAPHPNSPMQLRLT